LERRAELGKRSIRRAGIDGLGFYEKIKVPRKAGLPMQDNRVTSHNEVFNAMGMEGGQKVFVFLEHPAPPPNL
jgi:hypothetical protein